MLRQPPKRDAASNKYVVELDGVFAGWLSDVAGATACGDVETGPSGRRYSRRDEIVCRCWPGMPQPFYAWIERSFGDPPLASDGAIALVDPDGQQLSRMLWQEGVITSFTVPMTDAESREAAKVSLTLSPTATRHTHRRAQQVPAVAQEHRVPAPASGLRLDIDGLAEECHFIRRTEALTISQEIDFAPGRGLFRDGPVVASPLAVILPENRATGFFQWQNRMGPDAVSQRIATVTLGTPEVGFSVVLHNLRLLEVTPLEGSTPVEGEGRPRPRRDVRAVMAASSVGFVFLPKG